MTVEEAEKSIELASELKLSGAGYMKLLGPERVAAACNGAGPERMSERARAILSKWLWLFKPCFDIHDCEFTYVCTRDREMFDVVNDKLAENCKRVSNLRYKWYNPMRYVARTAAWIIVGSCREFGWKDWCNAYHGDCV